MLTMTPLSAAMRSSVSSLWEHLVALGGTQSRGERVGRNARRLDFITRLLEHRAAALERGDGFSKRSNLRGIVQAHASRDGSNPE